MGTGRGGSSYYGHGAIGCHKESREFRLTSYVGVMNTSFVFFVSANIIRMIISLVFTVKHSYSELPGPVKNNL